MGKRKRVDSDDDEDFTLDDDDDAVDDDFDDAVVVEDEDDADFEDEEEKPKKKKAKKETASTKKTATTKKATAKKTSTKESSTAKKTTTKKAASTSSTSKAKKKDNAIKSEPQAREVVYEYLKKTNRPYSVVNLVDNLHGQVKKAMGQKCLDKLVKDGKITLKENKKTKLYFINQEDMPVLDKEELKEMDDQIKELTRERNELKTEVANLTTEKAKYAKAMTNQQLAEEIQKLEEECERKQTRLDKLKGGTQLANPEDKKKAMVQLEKFLKHWRERKGIFKEVIDRLSEAADTKPSQLIEDIGLDTDESLGIPDMRTLGKLE